jgi:hypothetical protein
MSLGRCLHCGPTEALPAARLSDAYGMDIRLETVHGQFRALY